MHTEEQAITVTTNGDGDGVGYTTPVRGRVLQIRYVKPDSGGFADGVDFDITLEISGVVIWDQDNVNASVTVLPRQAVQDTAGAGATYDGTRAIREPVYVADERVKIAVANGGDTTTGTFYVLIG